MPLFRQFNKPKEVDDVKVIIVVPPDGGYSWLIVAASFYSNFIVDGFFYSFSVYLKAFQRYFNFSVIQVTFIGSAFQASYYFSGPVSCAFVNRYGFKICTFLGATLLATGFLFTTFFKSYVAILCVYGVISGVGAGFCYTASIIVVNYHFEKYRILATGLATTGSSVGSVCLSLGMGYVLSKYGLMQAFWVQTGLAASIVLCGLIYRSPKGTEVIIEAADIYESMMLDDDGREASIRNLLESSIDLNNNLLQSAIWNTTFQNRYMEILREEETTSKPKDTGWTKWICPCKRKPDQKEKEKKKIVTTRPFDRADILFRGSLAYQDEVSRPEKKVKPIKKHTMFEAFVDPELFESIPFICVLMCMLTFTMAMATPYMFLVERAVINKIRRSTAEWILPIISVGNTFGRIVCGVVSFMPTINVSYLVGTTSVFAGLLLIVSTYIGTESAACQFIVAFSLGFLFAFSTTLRTVCFVRYIGMKLLTSAFGVSLMIAGLAALSGTPIAGVLKSATGNYNLSFVFSGINMLASGGFAFAAEYIYMSTIKESFI